ncbi:MAG: hypothetical protein COS89_04745 [Deltaproteobacteria bacterium CG07_land_8_20_14_0_80_38_7]|nr:MAG: hypothetical protein COS89_04745 [Deltaproteobacteria bacterium CG07_land_8_20_14_0_80_38_7]
MKNNKWIVIFIIVLSFLYLNPAEAGKKSKPVEVYGGVPIPGVGIAIDASYDARLDNLAPGYRVLNVAIVNESLNIIALDPTKDEWWIKVSGKQKKKKYKLISDLRTEDAKAWNQIPEQVRKMISYPLALPIGGRQVIDLFVAEDVPVEEFTDLIVLLNSVGTTFIIKARQ